MDATDLPPGNYRPVVGFPGYVVRDDGTVWSSKKGGTWRALKQTVTRNKKSPKLPYRVVGLAKVGTHHTRYVHRLVLEAFVGECPDRMECRHLDGDPANNRLSNLCWGTPKENMADAQRYSGTGNCHQKVYKLTATDVVAMRELRKAGMSYRKIGSRFGIHHTMARLTVLGLRWSHIGGTE